MAKNILIGLNIIALLGSVYWLTIEHKPEPLVTLILTLANLVGLTFEDKINKNIFKSKVKIDTNYGNSSGSVQTQNNVFGTDQLKKTTQTNSLPCLVTIYDGDPASSQPVKEKPIGGIDVLVNSSNISVGDGHKNGSSYFSSDNGQNAKFINHIDAGDKLYWNGSIAGFQLDTSDNLRLDYMTK